MAPRIRFVRSRRGYRLATAVDGTGPALVLPAWWVSHVQRDFEAKDFSAFFGALATRFTVVRYDRVGVGLSDRQRTTFNLEDEVEDVQAVIEDLGLDRVSLLGISCGAPVAIALAARRPELVTHLFVFGGYLDGTTIGTADVQRALAALVRASWGLGSRTLCDIFLPDASAETAARFVEDQRESASGETSARLLELTYAMDVRREAPSVRVPTTVIHRREDRAIGFEHGREVAAAIPGAELVALSGREHLPWTGDAAAVLHALGITSGARSTATSDAGLVRDGDVWTIWFGGRTVHAKHALGLVDLATLVAAPGRHFEAIELMHAGTLEPPPRLGGSAVLDDAARAQFRARLDAIEEALAGAPAPTELARLESERDALLRELKAATGLGGRRRTLGDDAERARKAVTGRIRDSIARLRTLHPALGEHLATAVETGTTCCYAPATPVSWQT